MFPPELLSAAADILERARKKALRVATAESCTGGLVIACLTEIAGSSDVVERGFVTYSNAAKTGLLDVSPAMINAHGAVSREVSLAMVAGALAHSKADIAVSVTGIAGPGGGSAKKPVGLVYLAGMRSDGHTVTERCLFGDIGRDTVRLRTVAAALSVLRRLL